ncbi:hypothetical protein GYMLUDRAFT_167777, partial [Collybiopsis luxurians FD-317 M1]
VDSLCIAQDFKQDRVAKIVRIPQVFRDTYFTIVTARAPKVSEGTRFDFLLR